MAERSALKSRKVKPTPSDGLRRSLEQPNFPPNLLRLARVVGLGRDVEVRERGVPDGRIHHQLLRPRVEVHLRIDVRPPLAALTRTSIACLRSAVPGTTRRNVSFAPATETGSFTGSVARVDFA